MNTTARSAPESSFRMPLSGYSNSMLSLRTERERVQRMIGLGVGWGWRRAGALVTDLVDADDLAVLDSWTEPATMVSSMKVRAHPGFPDPAQIPGRRASSRASPATLTRPEARRHAREPGSIRCHFMPDVGATYRALGLILADELRTNDQKARSPSLAIGPLTCTYLVRSSRLALTCADGVLFREHSQVKRGQPTRRRPPYAIAGDVARKRRGASALVLAWGSRGGRAGFKREQGPH
jgi:hypothetical protein